ncbi:MAG: cytochrome C [Proteobacteria bacterium]|nr:cytochrome C [Pseudomonadota bacterium]
MPADHKRALRRGLGALMALLTLPPAMPAWSVPAFARAMGVQCAVCHTLAFGPALTAYGRNFKLHAYALGGNSTIPLSADLISSFTHNASAQPQPPHYSDNNNLALDDIDVYLAGRITEHSGAFAQVSYDGIARHTQWGVVDARCARDFTLGRTNALFGVTLNNFPTVQDPWNSTSAWQFPFPSPRLVNGPAGAPQLNGFFAGQALGSTAYALIGNSLYLEAGGYRQLANRLQEDVGVRNPAAEHALDGTAPYWRAALQKWSGSHYVSAGLLGFYPHAQTPQERGSGTDNYSDLGYDATYQFSDGGPHAFNAYLSYVRERARLFGATAIGGSTVVANHLNTLNISGQYVWRQTCSVTLAFFDVGGNSNAALFPASPWLGSANGRPDSRGYTTQLEWVPFGKADSYARPWLNVRVGLQYTAYTRFNGGDSNYDGFGHSAHDNNALFLFLWLAI